MLKHIELKNLLHVLTASLVVSVLIFAVGCAGINSKPQEVFYPEYYAAKRLDSGDIVKLRGLASSLEQSVSAPATLLLGINYLRYGNKDFGRLLINKSYNNPALDQQMKLFGKLWKMDALLSENNKAEAEKIRDEILATNNDDMYTRTLKIFCLNEGRPLKVGEDPIVCVTEKFMLPEETMVEIKPEVTDTLPEITDTIPDGDITERGTDNMTYEEYLKSMGIDAEEPKAEVESIVPKDATINVVGGDVMSEMVQGMIYAVGNVKAEFSINSISEDAAADMDESAVIINLTKTEINVAGQLVAFGINWDELIYTTAYLKLLESFPNIVVSASNSKIQYAKYLGELIAVNGRNVKVLNYDNPNFQEQLRSFMEPLLEAPILMVGVGSEEEITSFIPVAKFLQSNKHQEILVVTSSFTDRNLSNDYKQYYKDAYVISPIQTVGNRRFRPINLGYEAFFGSPMNLRNMLGYDAVVYLMSFIEPTATDKYITNIGEFIEGGAYRKIGFYRVDKKLNVTELRLETVEPPAEIEIEEEQVQ